MKLLQLLWLVLFVLLLAACDTKPKLSPLQSDSIVLAFGASITRGTGVSKDKSYPAVLSQRLGIKVINAGVPGEITEQGMVRLPGLLEQHKPDLVLISHGGNDILRKVDARTTKQNLRQMILDVRASGAEVVLIAIPKLSLFASAAPFYEILSESLDVPVELDIITSLQKSPKYKSDTIHFNVEGYALMAEAVETLLEQQGALRVLRP